MSSSFSIDTEYTLDLFLEENLSFVFHDAMNGENFEYLVFTQVVPNLDEL
jgi:hypothetical protein